MHLTSIKQSLSHINTKYTKYVYTKYIYTEPTLILVNETYCNVDNWDIHVYSSSVYKWQFLLQSVTTTILSSSVMNS
jgi:hypothetical protein